MSKKFKSVWQIVTTIAIVYLAFGIIMTVGSRSADRALSPGACRTIGCFARTKPAPVDLKEARIDGRDYIVWFGGSQPMWLMPSGPSCYVFDDHGRLLTWANHTGEGGEIERFAEPASDGTPADLATVLDRVGRE